MKDNTLTETLRPFVPRIQQDAEAGNPRAREVISLYGMYCRCPEPGAYGLCQAAFDEWRQTYEGSQS